MTTKMNRVTFSKRSKSAKGSTKRVNFNTMRLQRCICNNSKERAVALADKALGGTY